MSTIYVTMQGATVQRRSGQFLVCKDSRILENVPETHVRQLILFGNVNLTTPAVGFCLDQQIEVVFLTQGGRFPADWRALDRRGGPPDRLGAGL